MSDTRTPAPFAPVKQIEAGVLDIGYTDSGPVHGQPVVLLHGWPYDINSYAEVAPELASAGYRVVVPYLRGYGSTRFLSPDAVRNGQQSALAVDAIALMDALGISSAIVAGFDWGARTAAVMAALWPDRCKALVSVSGYLIGSQELNKNPLPPAAELSWWYQYYFATERGRAGYAEYRNEFAKLIWQTASPKWHFDDTTFARTASAFDNPDHVDVVIHNYRWRLGLAPGESEFDELERRLGDGPTISIPTMTLEGDANGAPHPDPSAYAAKFTGKYAHRTLTGGVGHNLPQEAPRQFVDAILEVDQYERDDRPQSSECEHVGLRSGVQELDLERVLVHGSALADELVQAWLVHHAVAVVVDIDAVIGARGLTVDQHPESHRAPARPDPSRDEDRGPGSGRESGRCRRWKRCFPVRSSTRPTAPNG